MSVVNPAACISDHAMCAAALHLVKAGRQWEPHPDGCVQADVLTLEDAGMDIVFWRGRGPCGNEMAVLAVLPLGFVTLAEVLDRPLAPWDVVPPRGYSELQFQHGTPDSRIVDASLVAPLDLMEVLQAHVHRVLTRL
jgi:hypothetical protein